MKKISNSALNVVCWLLLASIPLGLAGKIEWIFRCGFDQFCRAPDPGFSFWWLALAVVLSAGVLLYSCHMAELEMRSKTERHRNHRRNVTVDRKNIDRQPTADDEIDEPEICDAELQL